MRGQIVQLREHGWRVDISSEKRVVPQVIAARHGGLPAELSTFLGSFDACVSPSGKSWLVSAQDLVDPEAFKYNEFQLISLEAAGGDAEWAAEVNAFWRDHFPVMLSVSGSYQYFALALRGPNEGAVVYGFEPEFETPSIVASSLPEFLSQLVLSVQSPAPAYPFSHVLEHHGS